MHLLPHRGSAPAAFALVLIMALTALALLLATGIFEYTSTHTTLNYRNNEYHKAVAAAEAATEKVVAAVNSDFRDLGNGYVVTHLDHYRTMVPTAAESPAASSFVFEDLSQVEDRVEVTYVPGTTYSVTAGKYRGLHGIKNCLRVVANAKLRNGSIAPVGSVYQDIELLRIPLFQFAIFYNVELEFNNAPPMTISGPVHCNTNIYISASGSVTFNGDVTTAGTIYNTAAPGNPSGGGSSGAVTYNAGHDQTSALNLPIGTNGTPAAIHAVLDVPPGGEDPLSSMGQERYYNKSDLVILIDNSGITAKSGLRNNFGTTIPNSEILTFLSTNVTFYNKRELKTVQSMDLDVAKLAQWSGTNTSLRPLLPAGDISAIYIADLRTGASTEPGVRLINGQTLPPLGLTVATPDPLYIQGNFNAPAGALGTANTSGTKPASVVADAVTILSSAWSDANSSQSLSHRVAANTTVNAAMLTGFVKTSAASFSGGVENFPRFLEDWSGRTLTYNGSLVAMFYSSIATNLFRGPGSGYDIYQPPTRNWSWDTNFLAETKLPPATPNVTVLIRGSWRMPAPYSTNVLAGR